MRRPRKAAATYQLCVVLSCVDYLIVVLVEPHAVVDGHVVTIYDCLRCAHIVDANRHVIEDELECTTLTWRADEFLDAKVYLQAGAASGLRSPDMRDR